MEQRDVMHQMINFNRTLFDGAFEAAVQIQDQIEKIGNAIMDKATWLPGENRKIYDKCIEAYKSGRRDFKAYVDQGYQQSEKLFK